MRVCQFRHYGTVFYAPHRWPEHANRELLVLQTQPPLSMRPGSLRSPGFNTDREPGKMAIPVAQGVRLLIKKGVYWWRRATFPK